MSQRARRLAKYGGVLLGAAGALPLWWGLLMLRADYDSTGLERRGYHLVDDCSLDVGEGQRLDYWQAIKRLGGGSEQAPQPDAT